MPDVVDRDWQCDTDRPREGRERLRQYVFEEGLHVWPGSTDPVHAAAFGPVTTLVDATAEMQRFFGLV